MDTSISLDVFCITYPNDQKAGTASVSLISRLLDDYEAKGIVDLEHEYDMKIMSAVMYSGTFTRHTPS